MRTALLLILIWVADYYEKFICYKFEYCPVVEVDIALILIAIFLLVAMVQDIKELIS